MIAFLVLFMFLFLWGMLCDWLFVQPEFYDRTNKREWSLIQKNGVYDIGILGSSRAFGAFEMNELQRDRKSSMINLSAKGSGFADNFMTLEIFLANGNRLDTLLLQVDVYSLNAEASFSNALHIYEFLPYWKNKAIESGLSPYLGKWDKLVWDKFPFIRYIKYNKYFSPIEVLRRVVFSRKSHSIYDKTMGGTSENKLAMNLQEETSGKAYGRFDSLDVIYLGKIVDLCRRNKIVLIGFTAPEYIMHKRRTVNYDELSNRIKAIADSMGFELIKTDSSIELQPQYFRDPIHLNQKGRIQFGKYLNKSI